MRSSRAAFLFVALSHPLFSSSAATLTVTRGPYLQQGGTTNIVVRWRTSAATATSVRYGTNPAAWSAGLTNGTLATDHIVSLTGLDPDVKYYYEVGTGAAWFSGDTNDFFVTAPPIGTRKPTRIWVLGDSGYPGADANAVRNAYSAFTGARPTDLWLMLGDNAYENATDADHQGAIFDTYPTFLQNSVLWPTIGNHEVKSTDSSGQPPYFAIFTLPQNAEAGGLPSGTEKYYSFDYANVHFICLDSMSSDRKTTGPMCNWLRADLAATTQEWLIAFWHHPPYSKGSHDSDADTESIEMRQNFLPILEAEGVDLVLCGHSHSYERSFLLDGHYGKSSTITASMKKNAGSGRPTGTGAYIKSSTTNAHQGAVYSVAGSSSSIHGGSLNHPAMFTSLNVLGSLVIDVSGNRLDYIFLKTDVTAGDWLSIIKPPPPPTISPAPPTNLVAIAVATNQINLSWTDASSDETGFKIERSTNGTDFILISSVGAGVSSGADIGLAPGSPYFYRVRAYNSLGNSIYSEIAQATTFDPPPDVTAPAAVTNLFVTRVTSNSVALIWVAPGDDANSGTATLYDLRYNTVPITDAGWDLATPAVGLPAPAAAGNAQAFTVQGLASGATYFFGLKTVDETNNISPLSNVIGATTPVPDAPAMPTNLVATGIATNEIYLVWNDTADNEEGFFVERSTNGVDFVILGVVNAGITNAADLDVLPATTYWYRITATNAAGASPASDIAFATSLAPIPPDITPPSAVTNLSVTSVTSNGVTLRWTAPGDDGDTGTAASYELRISTALITESNWTSAGVIVGLPLPQPAGTVQSVSVINLAPGSTYFFALKTTDESNNVSRLSNVVSTTLPGLPAPWINTDIGAVGLAGRAGYSNNTFTVIGAGADIASKADSFHFLYQPANGDCEIIARVTGIQNTSSSAKGGVMIRETLTNNAPFASTLLTPNKKMEWLYRSSSGNSASSSSASGSFVPPASWVRLTRTNTTFTSYSSSDGLTWKKISSKNITMRTNVFMGIAVTSKKTSALNTSTFDRITASP
ncbi:MAG: acid phosphatase type 7 [Verrucomicrobiota bacterium]|jgi:regulation of enolase protein 1 (concanavalin A-like superfamily)